MELFLEHLASNVIVAAVVWTLCLLPMVRRRPSLCHGLWALTLLRLVTPPIAQIPVQFAFTENAVTVYESSRIVATDDSSKSPNGSVPPAVATVDGKSQAPVESVQEPSNAAISSRPRDPRSDSNKAAGGFFPTIETLIIGSLLITLCFWIVVTRLSLRISRLLRGTAAGGERSQRALERTAQRFRLRRSPRLIVVDAPLTPMLWTGLLGNAAIIIPRQLDETLDDQQLEHVMAHELAHWVRRDHWTNFIGVLVVSLVWWNPVAWFARRQMLAAAEVSCDALALNRLGHPRAAYARTLLRVIDFVDLLRPWPGALVTAFGSSRTVVKRFQNVCDSNVKSNLSIISRVILAVGVMMLAILPVRSEEKAAPKPPVVGMDPEVARDLVTILGDDFARVAGLPLKLVADPTGKRVYLPEISGVVSVYDTDTLRCIQKWPLHDQRCLEVAMTDAGRKLVSIAIDGTARLWDITGADPVKLDELKLAEKAEWVSMSPDSSGERIVFRTDGVMAIVDVRGDRLTVRKRLVPGDFTDGKVPFDYVVSPDGKWMVASEVHSTFTSIRDENQKVRYAWSDATLVLWDVTKDQPERTSTLDRKNVSDLTFSADSKQLFADDPYFVPDPKAHEWRIEDRKLVPGADLERTTGSFGKNRIFNEDGRLMARNAAQKLTITSKLGDKIVSRGTLDAGGNLLSATFVGDDVLMVAGHLLQRWDWRDGKYQQRKRPAGHHSSVMGMHFDPSTESLVSASADSSLVWKVKGLTAGQTVTPEPLPWTDVTEVVSYPDRKGFGLLQRTKESQFLVGLVRSSTGKFEEQFSIEMTKNSDFAECWCFAAHPTEQIVATGHHNHQIFLWDVSGEKPERITSWHAHNGHVCNLAFSPDGELLASVGWDHHTYLWEYDFRQARAGKIPKGDLLGKHADIVRSVAWSKDGKHLAAGGEDGQILLWKNEDGNVFEPDSLIDPRNGPPAKNVLNPATVGSLEFSRSGEHLLSADGRGTVSIWSVEKKTQLKKWQLPGWVWQASYSPDESTIAIANNDGTIYLVRAPDLKDGK